MCGKLLIAGGAINPSNAEIYNTFINLSGGRGKAVIGIIAEASSTPLATAKSLKGILTKSYGLNNQQVIIIGNSNYDYLMQYYCYNLNSLDLSGIWFTGGDQRRLQSIFYDKKGEETELFRFVTDFYNNGGIISGTSAGAAIMSNPIISGGHSVESIFNFIAKALGEDKMYEDSSLALGKGLGIFHYGIIDQHFGERDRLGRLVLACSQLKSFGYGIDENTALLVDSRNKTLEAIGCGGVTIIDARNAELNLHNLGGSLGNIKLSYLKNGNIYNLISDKSNFLYKELGTKIINNNSKYTSSYKSSYLAFIGLLLKVNTEKDYSDTTSFQLKNIKKDKITFNFKKTGRGDVFLKIEIKFQS